MIASLNTRGGSRPPGAMPKKSRLHRHYLPSRSESTIHLTIVGVIFLLTSCATPDRDHRVVISTSEQKLALLEKGRLVAVYPVSTSKFGLGDARGSCRTPLGELEVADKIGYRRDIGHRVQGSPSHRRGCSGRFAGSRSNRHTYPMAARPRTAECERVCAHHLHSRNTGRTKHRAAGKLWVCSDALARHHHSLRLRWEGRAGKYRERAIERSRSDHSRRIASCASCSWKWRDELRLVPLG